jgi:hypothetical protein
MTVQIFTSVVNRPQFLELQVKLFSKFLEDDYQFHVVYDDGIDKNILKQFENICQNNNLILHKADDCVIDNNPSTCISKVVKWIYYELLIKTYHDDICMIVDSDMFLIDKFNVQDYISEYPIAGIPQYREHVKYITNQLMIFNMKEIIKIDQNIDFMDGIIENQHVDSCGEMYYWFKRNNIDLKEIAIVYPTHFNDIELQDPSITNGINFEMHGDIFLHYRAGSNWFSKWKENHDPLIEKQKIFNQIMDIILDNGNGQK